MTFTACEKDPADLFSTDAVAPVLENNEADLLLTENTLSESVTFTWSEARHMQGDILYTLYAQMNGQALSLTSTSGLYFTASKAAFRTQLIDGFNLDPNNNFSMDLYVVADNGVQQLKSQNVTKNVFIYGDYVAAVVSPAEGAEEGIVLSESATEEVALLTWTEARFEYGVKPLYKVEASYADGARTELASGLTKQEFGMSHANLNSTMIALGCPKDEASELKFIVTAYLEGEGAPSLASEAVVLSITTYTPSYPEFLNVVGDFGGLNWGDTVASSPILKGDPNTGEYHGLISYYGATWGAKIYYLHPKSGEAQWVGGKPVEEGSITYSIGISIGDNIAPEAGSYVVYVNLGKGTMTLAPISSIGLIGSATANGWDAQTNFEYNAETGLMELKGIELGTGAYKVRVNDNWGNPWEDPYAYNLGGKADDMTFGGADITAEPGVYDVTMNLASNLNYALSFTKTGDVEIEDPSSKIYSLIGAFNEWNGDVDFVEHQNGFVKAAGVALEGEFKIRVNHDWAENFGLAEAGAVAEGRHTLVANGQNMTIAAGNYDLYFNPTSLELIVAAAGASDPTATVYSLIGAFNGWSGDVDMVEHQNGFVKAAGVAITGNEFKVRANHAWADSWGFEAAGTVVLGQAYTLVYNGQNMSLADGSYDFYFNPESLAFYAVTAGADDPTVGVTKESIYGLVGDLNGWVAPDVKFTDKGNGEHVLLGQSLEAGKGFKIRANEEWNDAENYGTQVSGAVAINRETTLINGGGSQNMTVETTATYDLYFYPAELKLFVMEPGKTPADAEQGGDTPVVPNSEQIEVGLIGVGGDWNNDLKLTQQADGSYLVENVTLTATDTFKVRKAGAWDDNFNWGLAAKGIVEVGVLTDLTCGGGSADMSVAADGQYNIYFYPTLDGTAVVKGQAAQIKIETVGGQTPPAPQGQQIEVGLVGSMTSWSSDVAMTKQADGSYLAEKVALTAADEFKVRKAGAWDDNFNWGPEAATTLADGVELALICGGGAQNMKVAADGNYNIYFYPTTDEGGVIPMTAAKIKVEKLAEETPVTPTPSVLEWSSSLFEQFYNTLGGDNYTEDVDLGNGLKFIAGGSKCKFGVNSGSYRIQLGGSGNTSKCTLQLEVSGPGTLTVDIQSSGDTARYLAVAVDGSEVTPAEGLEAPDKTSERKVHTIDCTTAKAGSVINMYSKGSAINVFVVKWTPAL